MKKILIIFYMLIAFNVYAAAPTRQKTYTPGETISSSDVTANEDAIFNYLSAGVDTYKALSLTNAAVSATANIQSDKLNLTSMAQNLKLTTGYSFENDGTTQFDGTVALNAKLTAGANEIEGSAFDINGGAVDAITLGTNSPVTSAVITTADINGGTLDGVNIGTTTATGEIIVNDASDDADGLGAQGTSGQYLQSAGAGVNPTWATISPAIEFVSKTTITDGTVANDVAITQGVSYKVFFRLNATEANSPTISLIFNNDTGASYANEGSAQGDGDTAIDICPLMEQETEGLCVGEFIMMPQQTDRMGVSGQSLYMDDGGSQFIQTFAITGAYDDSDTVTTFDIVSTQDVTGIVLLYKLNES